VIGGGLGLLRGRGGRILTLAAVKRQATKLVEPESTLACPLRLRGTASDTPRPFRRL
jgi:hypothetical protein